tara:strand:+ start:283 stop:447 length:165 start_codon:yes stop_codon:yes gene_type:complete
MYWIEMSVIFSAGLEARPIKRNKAVNTAIKLNLIRDIIMVEFFPLKWMILIMIG